MPEKKDKVVILHLSNTELERLDKYAADNDYTRSHVIREAIKSLVKK